MTRANRRRRHFVGIRYAITRERPIRALCGATRFGGNFTYATGARRDRTGVDCPTCLELRFGAKS